MVLKSVYRLWISEGLTIITLFANYLTLFCQHCEQAIIIIILFFKIKRKNIFIIVKIHYLCTVKVFLLLADTGAMHVKWPLG